MSSVTRENPKTRHSAFGTSAETMPYDSCTTMRIARRSSSGAKNSSLRDAAGSADRWLPTMMTDLPADEHITALAGAGGRERVRSNGSGRPHEAGDHNGLHVARCFTAREGGAGHPAALAARIDVRE